MLRVVKPKTQRARRFLEDRAPKLVENCKTALLVRGGRTSETVTSVLRDLQELKKPHVRTFRRRNPLHPFDEAASLEFFSQKSDASLFAFASHSKKRPHNLVVGRLFDYQLLDMVEFGVESFRAMVDFATEKCAAGSKPCLVFQGALFDTDTTMGMVRNLFIDFFRGPVVSSVNLAGIDHVCCFTATEPGRIALRVYRTLLKKTGTRLPRVELEEMGPRVDLAVRRSRFAPEQKRREVCAQPAALAAKKVKNVERNELGATLGRVHVGRQDLSKLQLRRTKALKKRGAEEAEQSAEKPQQGDNAAAARKRPRVTKRETE